MGWFDGWDWGAIAKAVLPAAATVGAAVIGANVAKNANTNAANIAQGNTAANTKLLTDAGATATGLITPVLNQGNAMAAPGINYLRTVTAQDPYTLNPAQQRDIADRTLAATRGVPLSLRGSGRTSTAIINDTVNRAKDAAITQNLGRSDAAANTLTSQGMSTVRTAAPALANIATGQASNIAAQNTSAAETTANAGTATANSDNAALSAIASYFAKQNADASRPSQYATYKAGQPSQ